MSRACLRAIAVVLIVLVWGHTGAVSMLVSLAGQRVLSCHRATILRVAQQQLRRQYERESSGRELAFRWKGRGLASTMSTTSRPVSASLEDCVEGSQRGINASGGDLSPQPTIGASAPTLARVVPAEEPWLTEAGDRFRAGELVAFPTETVYGLGANALSEAAVLKIFQAKQRPLTDPLIVHVPDTAGALAVVDFGGEGGGGNRARRLLALLGDKLWPGPLTLILKAADGVPACVTAGTGFVGVRCPAHPVARQLLSIVGVPVAAPSANRFGHVSPTQAAHVMEDLGGSDILVLDGDALGACGVGIESTVAKIDVANERILILRMGGVTQTRLREALKEGGEEFARISVHAGSVAGGKAEAATGPGDGEEALSEREPAGNAGQAPGQLLRHYSPDLEVFRVMGATADGAGGHTGNGGEPTNLAEMAKTSVVVDFAGQLKRLQASALAYSDLSVKGDAEEAAEGLFRALRWAEGQPLAQRLLIAGLPSASSGDLAAAVNDRIYRAACGKTISVQHDINGVK